jgi:MFS family permease
LRYVPAVVAVGYWFEKRRSLVTGISTCGSGAGTIVFAPLVTTLEKSFGWQGCNQMLAGLCLLCALFGMAMKPVPLRKPDEEDSVTEMKRQNDSGPYSDAEFDYMDGEKIPASEELKLETQVEENAPKTGICQTLRNPAFLLIMLGNLPAVMGLYIPYMFLPAMSEERGLTSGQAALLISLIGLFNTAGRVISGAITDHPKIDALFVTCFALGSGALCPFFMDLCGDFPSYIVVSIMFGLTLSAWPAVTSSMLVDLLGLEQLTSGFGALTCIRGLAAFLGPPLAGFVIDISGGNYSYAFWISASLLGLSSVVHFIAFFVKRRMQAK